ncbi:MAG: AI-2E family transporter [Candidatus Woesearchaeota archaeon]
MLFALIVILAILLVYPFIIPLLTSLILAYIFYPIYTWLREKTKRKNLSALLVSVILILILVIPMGFIMYQVTKEINVGYVILKQKLAGSTIPEFLSEVTGRPEVQYYIEDGFAKLSSKLTEGTLQFVFTVPTRLFELMLTFFFTFFLLKDGPAVVAKIEKNIPLRKIQKEEILTQIHGTVYAIIFGFFVMALTQGIIGAVTFKLFGVASPVFWGIVIAFLTFVPFIGGTIIWIPAAIIQGFHGQWFNVVGLTVGGIIITYVDTLIKPKMIGDKADIHPAIILIGLLGGLKLLGIVGIIIGPIILSLFVMFVKTFVRKK